MDQSPGVVEGHRWPTLCNVVLESYKSIRQCDVPLQSTTFLVGRNGAGKSNFLDAIRFVHDAIDTNLQTALAAHGAAGSVRRVGSKDVAFTLTFRLDEHRTGSYSLRFSVPGNSFDLVMETVTTKGIDGEEVPLSFHPTEGQSRTLSLAVAAAANPAYRVLYDFIRSMRFYDFNLTAMRAPQDPGQNEFLRADGSNLASVLRRLIEVDPYRYSRLKEYLAGILPGLTDVTAKDIGPNIGIQFIVHGGRFWARHMSTGTLHALATLVALFQPPDENGEHPRLVALEEPERALHPAALGVMFDAILEASDDRQVLVATQSPDLLDRKDVPADDILAVLSTKNGSQVGKIKEPARRALAEHLYTAGELIRLDHLDPAE